MNGHHDVVLIGGIEKRRITIADYDPRWPDIFSLHARVIAFALGEDALQIEHIGSTSVPGLAGKPIVDILLVVANSSDEAGYLPVLEGAGYVLRVREPAFDEHRMLRTPARDVHIHVFSSGSREIGRYLVFRDRLRSNVHDRRLYEATKRRLAAQDWPDWNAYADAKTGVVEAIIARGQHAAPQARLESSESNFDPAHFIHRLRPHGMGEEITL